MNQIARMPISGPPEKETEGVTPVPLDRGFWPGEGPVFTREGNLIGLTTDGESDRGARAAARLIPIHHSCDVIAAAGKKMAGLTPPADARLPVEPMPAASASTAAAAPRKPTDVGGVKVTITVGDE